MRRFGNEQFVFDDQIGYVPIVGNEMPNLPYPIGSDLCVRLSHVFEMRDGRIVREVAYEMWREEGASNAVDYMPLDAKVITFGAEHTVSA